MTKKKTVERQIEQAILQASTTVEVGGKTYEVAPPSIATLIKVSALVSEMPEVNTSSGDFISETLRVAKDCRAVGEIIATIILGAKHIRDHKRSIIDFGKTELQSLADAILYEKTPKEIEGLLATLIAERMDVVFFSNIITSLSAVNMTRPTKETTASGRQ